MGCPDRLAREKIMKILISSKSFGKEDTGALNLLRSAGLEPVLNPYGRSFEFDEFSERIRDAAGLIAGTEKITGELLQKARSLKVISRFGVGTDNIDLEAAKKLGIIVYTTPEAPTQAVAELALSMMLGLSRKICETDRNMHSGIWSPLIGSLLSGKTLGIIGLGRIGRELVRLVAPFKLGIIAHELYPDPGFISQYGVKLESLEKVMSESDIVSLHMPLSSSTRHIIGEKEISLMKPHAILINTARGGLVDENALIKALERGSIGGAGLDVFEIEPYKGKLIQLSNVILTPHIGSNTRETRIRMEKETVENLIKALSELKMK